MAGFLGCMGDVHHPLDIMRVIGSLGTGEARRHRTEFQISAWRRYLLFSKVNLAWRANREVTEVTERRFSVMS